MRYVVMSAVSAVALFGASAWAQDATAPTAPATPPAATTQAVPERDATGMAPAPSSAMTAAPSGKEISAEDMIGRDVYGQGDEELGEVTDVVLDPQSKAIRKLVIGTGGFLGLGQKTVAIDVEKVEIRPEQGVYVSGLTQEAVKAMPDFDVSEGTVSLDPPPQTGTTSTGTTSPTAPSMAPPPAGGSAAE